MSKASWRYPETSALATALAAVFGVDESSGELVVLARHANVHASTFPSEFVTCALPGQRQVELFCKYAQDEIDTCFGHRRSTAYEARVYRELLEPYRSATPALHGTFTDRSAGSTWLVLERLCGAQRVTHLDDPTPGMRATARWLGWFHATNSIGNASTADFSDLINHDASYFAGWIHRTVEFARPLRKRYPWLSDVTARVDELTEPLLTGPRVIIHGEFYPHNVLVRGDATYALDWQSAARSVGEIDIAALTERWPAAIVEHCEQEYRKARWPEGPPADYSRTLEAAQTYWLFRWLGDRPEWTLSERSVWRFEHLHRALVQRGFI